MQKGSSGIAGRLLWLLIVAIGCGGFAVARAASMDPKLLPGIEAATFEVVSAKPEADPLHYEKPLPLDLLPYQERTDKYYSIGTAFAIGNGRYVTAGHVLLSGVNSLWGPPALRDNSGHVYAIDKVQKFSLEKDFVVFTLRAPPNDAALVVDTHPVPGEVVYSVGNAYGTGVVIRDGLYTSDTPEQQDGRWKWLRFSAPASPGNSGGPLVDNNGKVIGVVLAKSPNENLNYALAIGMVQDAPDHLGEMDERVSYQFDVFDSTLSNTLKAQFTLPLSLADFFAVYQLRTNTYFDGQLKALLARDPERTFPNGEGSSELLNSIPTMGDAPKVIARDSGGQWVISGEAKDEVRLSDNGYFTPGNFGKNQIFHLRRPDNVPVDRFYADPSASIDLWLKSGLLKRTVGSETIAVTAMGKPTLDITHVDAWGRRWQMREWPLPYANGMLLVASLPVPDGSVGIARYSDAMQEHDQLINVLALTDFVYANYDGTFAQWKEFMQHPQLLPAALKDVHVDIDYGHRFRYDAPRLVFGYTPELQAIQADSMLTLGFAFFRDHGTVTWAPAEIWVSDKGTDNNAATIVRNHEPPKDLGDEYRSDWDKIVHRQHPYDATARSKDDMTRITTVASAAGATDGSGDAALYTVTYAADGNHPQQAMQAKLDLLLKDLTVKEH